MFAVQGAQSPNITCNLLMKTGQKSSPPLPTPHSAKTNLGSILTQNCWENNPVIFEEWALYCLFSLKIEGFPDLNQANHWNVLIPKNCWWNSKSLLKIAVFFQKKKTFNPSKQLSWLSTSIRSDWLWMAGTLGMVAPAGCLNCLTPPLLEPFQKVGPRIKCWDPIPYIHVI